MELSINSNRCKLLIILCIVLAASFIFSVNSFAQDEGSFQWRKSAKSLTTFKPGDAISITIWDLYQTREDVKTLDLSGQYPIYPDGSVVLPLLGEVQVRGLTAFEVSQLLTDKYKAYFRNPYIYARPLIRLTLQGAFNQPGSYLVDPASSLWEVIAMAGGPDGGCDLDRMWVERSGEIIMENFIQSFEKGHSLDEVGIISGDQILAPHRRAWNLQTALMIFNFMSTIALIYLRFRGIG